LRFVADLHIHSHLSRATSKDLDLERLHRFAQLKGVTVVGTGDFTHPGWMAELREKLVPAPGDPGLFVLRPDLAGAIDADVPAACRAPVRFLLSVEVSSIYKRAERVRKVHNLIYVPDFEAADRVAAALGRLGNVASDGRPILGVDSRDVLEITLASSPDAFLVPAHIWTPWFSALGGQSGFDSIADCFADLAGHVFAAETGLSSDPAMNWRLSALDRYALVSNSDAHSPEKLGREASLFDCDLSYFAIRDALRDRREQFLGTVEFFPEEGKYHFDGHRKCEVALTPAEAAAAGHLCPRCGKRLTAGVMSRVDALADRSDGFRPAGARPFHSLVPLRELLGEVIGAGPATGRVQKAYERLLARVGPELALLTAAPCEEVAREAPPLLDEALRRMRRGEVKVRAGYDGEYGVVRVFDEDERRRLLAQTSFGFSFARPASVPAPPLPVPVAVPVPRARAADALHPEQIRVVEHGEGPLLVVAGPGTGKTRTVVARVVQLVRARGVSPRAITAITFTRRAAGELRERLAVALGTDAERVAVQTFHALGLDLLRAFPEAAGLPPDFTVLDDEARQQAVQAAVAECGSEVPRPAAALSWVKAQLLAPPGPLLELHAAYQRALDARGAVDQDDLVARAARLLAESDRALDLARERCRHLFVDEYQDVNAAQDRLVRLLAPPLAETNLCAVGDPDQAIYGFRGADPAHFARFAADYPGAVTITLTRNFRSSAAVVRAASAVIARAQGRAPRRLEPCEQAEGPAVERLLAADDIGEGEVIAAEIERALGGTSLEGIHAGRGDGAADGLAFHDVAVLVRLNAQADVLAEVFTREGIPFHRAGTDGVSPATGAEAEIQPQKIALLTLHAAKGLEWPLVFVTGCEEALLPLSLPGLTATREEERRLLYVGMTRARQRLVLTSARRRRLFGRMLETRPSPFLDGLPEGLLVARAESTRPRRARQLSMF
jgi:DNA helicase-2/ATP-dependent DNA helicase PcrA